jgi:hypothetical protein
VAASASFVAGAATRSASFFSWVGLLTFSKKDPKMLARLVGLGFSSAGLTAASSVLTSSAGAAAASAGVASVFSSSPTLGMSSVMTGASVVGATAGATAGASSLISGALEDSPSVLGSSFFSSALSFFPSRPPKMEARLREAERDLDFFAFFSSAELLDADPVRSGAGTTASSVAGTSVSAGLGVASVLFLGAEAVAAASVAGLPTRC